MIRSHRAVVGAALAALSTASLVACSSSGGASPGSGSVTASGGSTAAAKVANVTITAAGGCRLDSTTLAAGGVTFKVQNKDATAVSEIELLSGERILGEKENIPPGLGGQFAANLSAGKYTVYCPGAPVERSTVTVVGKSAKADDTVAALLKTATSEYTRYVDTQLGYLVTTTEKLDRALHGTSLAAAQTAYINARPFYEKVEPVAESFVIGKDNLDADIDARVNDVPRAKWSGFHLIEQRLWVEKSLSGTGPWGDRLVSDVKLLQRKAKSLTFQAPDLANGAQSLLDEVASTKITGEEERYSHIDIVDMANNVEGSEQAYADLQPALERIDPALSTTIEKAFAALDTMLAKYRTTKNVSGYTLYTALTPADKRAMSAAVKAVAEPLSQVAGKVANG